jgi:hypothetical protein
MKVEIENSQLKRKFASLQADVGQRIANNANVDEGIRNMEADYRDQLEAKDVEYRRIHAVNVELSEQNAKLIEENRRLRDRVHELERAVVKSNDGRVAILERQLSGLRRAV